jgi:SAM-dependent methyltransferase
MSMASNWAEYWLSGQTGSCFRGREAVDTGGLWAPVFELLPAGARILDLACGAGAVARIALDAERGFAVTGVDYAPHLPPLSGATLMSGVSIEHLPFEDSKFDAVLSQYGFEYASVDAAAEAVRVLAPGGRLAFLMHAEESQPIAAARERLGRVGAILAASGPARIVQRLGEASAQGAPTPDLADLAARALQNASAGRQDETTLWALSFLNEILSKRSFFPPAYLTENAATLIRILTAYRDRLSAMSKAALSRAQAEAVARRLGELGLEAEGLHAATVRGDQIGWLLQGKRRPG